MIPLPELLMQLGLAWLAALAIPVACLWLAALRRVLRDLRRVSPIMPEQARCGLPKPSAHRAMRHARAA
jgi:hypothetical protein